MDRKRADQDKDTGAICCNDYLSTTPETSHAAISAGRQNRRAKVTPDRTNTHDEDNEHRIAAREFFAKHGYRPLSEGQSNAVYLIGIVKPRGR